MSRSIASQPRRVLFLQTQAEMAGAQEISRLLGDELSKFTADGQPAFEIHHLFLYRKTAGCDHFPNVHFAAAQRPTGIVSAFSLLRNLVVAIRDIRPDVLLTFQHYGNVVGAPMGKILRVPRIIANHVSAPLTISAPVRVLDRLIGISGLYDVITVNSHATLNEYRAYPDRYARKLVHVPHGFAERVSSIEKSDSRLRFHLPQDVPLIGSVARLHPLKQLDLAINTLPDLPGVHLAIAGQGPDRERLAELTAQLGLQSRVHFVGEMPPTDIGAFLKALDVFVFPTAAETFGLAAVEAAQSGIPVVANDLPVLREVLQVDQSPCAMFVDARDTRSFARAIDRLLSDQTYANNLVEQGLRLSERYSLSAMVDQYRDLIAGEATSVTERHDESAAA